MLVNLFLPTQVESFSPLMKEVNWEREKQTALICEKYGFEGISVPDHLQLGSGANFEAFTTLASLAESTTKVNLLVLVASVPFRNPALMAKVAATIDVISKGRFQLGIGAGWHRPEFEAYGYKFEDGKTRVDQLREAAELINRLWREEEVNFEGDYYKVQGCVCDPKPVKPYLVIGGDGPRIQGIAKKYADEWNFPGNFEEMLGRVSEMGETKVSWFGGTIVSRDEDYVEEMTNRADPNRLGRYIAGTPEEVTEKLEKLEEHGISRAILRAIDYPRLDSIRLLGEEVIPRL